MGNGRPGSQSANAFQIQRSDGVEKPRSQSLYILDPGTGWLVEHHHDHQYPAKEAVAGPAKTFASPGQHSDGAGSARQTERRAGDGHAAVYLVVVSRILTITQTEQNNCQEDRLFHRRRSPINRGRARRRGRFPNFGIWAQSKGLDRSSTVSGILF